MSDLSLTVEEGEYFVVLGPSGVGKTVILEMIAGLIRPNSGPDILAGSRHHAHTAGKAQIHGDVSGLRAVYAHERSAEHRLRTGCRWNSRPGD